MAYITKPQQSVPSCVSWMRVGVATAREGLSHIVNDVKRKAKEKKKVINAFSSSSSLSCEIKVHGLYLYNIYI